MCSKKKKEYSVHVDKEVIDKEKKSAVWESPDVVGRACTIEQFYFSF